VPFLLDLSRLWPAHKAEGRRLLRVLQLRRHALSAEAAGKRLLRLINPRPHYRVLHHRHKH